MIKAILGAVTGAALVAVVMLGIIPATASTGPGTSPEPYQAKHAWSQDMSTVGATTLSIPANDRLVITTAGATCPTWSVEGTLNGLAVNYIGPPTTNGGPGTVTDLSDAVDGSSSATAFSSCSNVSLSGYLVPLP